ncbi:queuine tRNA-ribosyltransferase accessory subunit 2-like isoform X2 [Asparagus officinalis]|uniref:queuine tRNA-ribosyltransferase accessory subunit 2-like isoform X2 n=1 Tax=Asparagus officinalis TaxID=4686 RepID=UPI00098DE85D|nr:queuine tRNA-ribosyltransferase accessory subunit 2-like isoform X2 [Asparagus officinalis]
MRFAVSSSSKACSGNGRARAGVLYPGSGGASASIETPSLLISTRKGLPTFMSRDLMASLPLPHSRLLHVSPLNFVECPSMKTISSIGGLHQMLGLQDFFFVASARDSVQSLPESGATNKLGASFETPSGRRLVKPSDYMEMICSLKPNLWASLADEVPAWVSEKRNKASVDRTIRWLDDCLSLDEAGGTSILGSIVGGSNIEERKRCAIEAAMRNVSGFWIGGFGQGESMEERPALLNIVTDSLPKEKLRYVSGLALPEVLQGVAAGIDLFDSTYIYHLTLGGFALIFPLDILENNSANQQHSDIGSDCTKINLRATIYRKDTSPIVDNCTCFTCKNHTRAYINHLLNVHEMLAQILLEIHNTRHYMGFFQSIREAIKCGKFDTFRQNFIDGRRAHITSAAVCL